MAGFRFRAGGSGSKSKSEHNSASVDMIFWGGFTRMRFCFNTFQFDSVSMAARQQLTRWLGERRERNGHNKKQTKKCKRGRSDG